MGGASMCRFPMARVVVAMLFATAVVATAHAQDAKPDAPPAAPPAAAAPPAPVAAPAEVIVPPTDPVARAAFDVLEKNCARCHQAGKLVSRERPAKGFGNVLKLDELAANSHYIRPGNPLDSFLFRQILDKQMPYDVYQDYSDKSPAAPVEADLKALEAWINGLGAKNVAACESHKLISPDDMVRFMVTDIDKQLQHRKATTRYLTLTHLANVCAAPNAMKVYRQAAIKLLNSLGRSSDVVKLETIDPEGTILRFNLVELGWGVADWDNLIAVYNYNVQPKSEFTQTLANAAKTPQAYVRADWFAFTASQPELYDTLLKLPNTFQALAKAQGVDVEANIKNFVAQRAGFQKSGVSQNNRLIERHPSQSGYFWTSYDFAGNKDHQSLFDFPLGPSTAGFHHDGGETIFSLPNGFQAYYLNKATGERLDKGPTTIVRDESRKDFAVTNGISCMGCHDQGMRKAKDEIRDLVVGKKSFPSDVRDAVDGLYPPREKMDALIEGDFKRFTGAMVLAGLDTGLKLNGVEMINALAKHYEENVDLALAAAELGIEKADLIQSAGDVDPKFRPLVRRVLQSSVPRDQFEAAFRELAPSLTEQKVVVLPPAPGPKPTPKPTRSDDLALTSDANTYKVNDSPVFTIISARDCFLTLTDIDQKGEGTVLLPNGFQQDNRIKAGVPIQFPGPGAKFKFQMKDPGVETVTAVCATQADGGDRILHDFQKNAFTPVQDYDRVLSKAIAVVPATPGTRPPSNEPRPSSRAAIKVTVR